MKKICFLLTISFIGITAFCQKLTLVPQIGVQSIKTKLEYSDIPNLDHKIFNGAAYLGVRFVYESKKGHGPYIGIGTGGAGSGYEISERSLSSFGYSKTSSPLKLELGYQWNTKPVYFKKILNNNLSKVQFEQLNNKGWHVRFQPNIGIASHLGNAGYTLTGAMGNVKDSSTYYGNKNFALTTGINFVFGKNNRDKFSLSFNYVKGFGDLERTFINYNSKRGILSSNGTSWNITFSIPITLLKRK